MSRGSLAGRSRRRRCDLGFGSRVGKGREVLGEACECVRRHSGAVGSHGGLFTRGWWAHTCILGADAGREGVRHWTGVTWRRGPQALTHLLNPGEMTGSEAWGGAWLPLPHERARCPLADLLALSRGATANPGAEALCSVREGRRGHIWLAQGFQELSWGLWGKEVWGPR